jgi:hypothetical protein
MNAMLLFVAWCLLFAVAWPVAILALLLLPAVWLLSIPFRVLGLVVEALLALVRAVLFMPARLLGARR